MSSIVKSGILPLLRCLDTLADRWQTRGRPFLAEAALRGAVLVRRAALRPEHPDTLGGLNKLAAALQRRGSFASAEPCK